MILRTGLRAEAQAAGDDGPGPCPAASAAWTRKVARLAGLSGRDRHLPWHLRRWHTGTDWTSTVLA